MLCRVRLPVDKTADDYCEKCICTDALLPHVTCHVPSLVGLDGRTVPAVFSIASHERLAVHDSALHDDDDGGGGGGDESEEAAVSLDRQSLALHHRQFGLAYAGMQPTLE